MGAVWNGVTGTVTDVGSGGPGSQTYYGAADMAGNVYEWNEGIVSTNSRCIRGGAWYSVDVFLQSGARSGYSPSNEFDSVGFRIATR
jgi:formylglycine-generating enzyme required for sulfatase activity